MLLSRELHNQLVDVLGRCEQFFDDPSSLRALFVTNELQPLKSRLPSAHNQDDRIRQTIHFLLSHSSSSENSSSPLLSFLELLRDQYQQGDALHDELNKLCNAVGNAIVYIEIDSSSTFPQKEVSILNELYVKRPELQKCCKEVRNLGSLIRIKSPRQMGKTWLMQKTLECAKEHGLRTIVIDFSLAETEILPDINKLLQWMCFSSSQELGLVAQVDTLWNKTGAKNNTTNYFKNYLLPAASSDLVLALDNVDVVFGESNVVQDFCGLLRGWVNKARAKSDAFQKLHLIVVHSTEEYGSFNIKQSPLNNVGTGIALGRLNFQQICQLAQQYELLLAPDELERVKEFLGGHPYLVNIAFLQMANAELTLAELFRTAYEEYGIYGEHLRRHRGELEGNQNLLDAFKLIISSVEPVKLESRLRHQLRSMGLIDLASENVTVSCEVYRQFFCNYLRLQSE